MGRLDAAGKQVADGLQKWNKVIGVPIDTPRFQATIDGTRQVVEEVANALSRRGIKPEREQPTKGV